MLYSKKTAEEKRRDLRAMLVPGAARQFPGAFNPLSARLIEEKKFDGVYISGAVLANDLGLPDIGMTTLTEVATRGGQIARMTDLPCLIDGKNMVDLDTAVKRIAAAADARRDPNFLIMARTDIRAVEGLDAAIDRAKALVDAGADAIFPEAMKSVAEFEAVCKAVDVPVLANMTEFGKSELFTRDDLAAAGVAMIIYPVTLLRSAMGAAERVLDAIAANGTQESSVPQMLTRARLYDLVDYEAYNHFDTGIFNFQIPSLDIESNNSNL